MPSKNGRLDAWYPENMGSAMKRLTVVVSLLSLGTAALADPHAAPIGPCTTLTGTTRVVETYGPPNYGETPATDSRMRSFVLTLGSPVNALVRDVDSREHEVDGLREVQIVDVRPLSTAEGQQERKLQQFHGCLYFGESGHHITKVILDIARSR
jgi:hypothetical protein